MPRELSDKGEEQKNRIEVHSQLSESVTEKFIRKINNEFEILKTIDHPNIVRLIEVYQTDNNFYFVTEYCKGYQLLKEINYRIQFSEPEAAHVIK